MRLFGLIGYPLSHSFSEQYFTKKFEREGLKDCRYTLFPLSGLEEFPGLLMQNAELEGLNVTIPYKQRIIPFLDSVKDIPAGLDACNCIRVRPGNLEGFNTDATAFEKSISPLLLPHHKNALILGNGGAARAVAFVFRKMGIAFRLVSRSLHDDSSLTYKDLDENIIASFNIIVNASPAGMYPQTDSYPDIPYQFLSARHLLYDLVYNPGDTLFLKKGRERGARTRNGEEMLELQAEESWRIWNDR